MVFPKRTLWNADANGRHHSPYRVVALLTAASLAGIPAVAHAAVTISSAATQNITCTGGVCTPTAPNAVLNAGDLETMLAAGNATVTTTGSGGIEATDIDVDTAVAWASSGVLALQAYRSVAVAEPIAVNGASGLSIVTDNGGSGGVLSFASGANVSFLNLASTLSINGAAYTLENSIATLASAVASNAAGNYALANDYDASHDGTYKNSPIPPEFFGNFEGLGNTISNLSLKGTGNNLDYVGLFAKTGASGQSGALIENIVLQNANVTGKAYIAAALVGYNGGTVRDSYAGGSVNSDYKQNDGAFLGLLAGLNYGTISLSAAKGTIVTGKPYGADGGLVGSSVGIISQSYADCTISSGEHAYSGGLAGGNTGAISDSYALGGVTAEFETNIGGLVGGDNGEGTITGAYSAAAVKLRSYPSGERGGLIGDDTSPRGSNTSTYWDLTTSGVRKRSEGAGNIRNDPGITGETTTQLQAGLPAGFDPTVWAQSPSINSGLPYLIANPPR